ncbi:MAG: Transcriptional regulator, Fis family [Candidatus Gallionella acididurans]|uniref:Putative Fis-like DNA-binding protein n=1 Tax=Candidatus Gallionella acididurans TaxID=1796491 RepID=A0A139BRN9_9PROT|nr:MAG: Transcriptional regulator, Fis family [Candidatus Gallionella acididurans]
MNDLVVNENDMARHVRKTLKEYFRDLDGEKPCSGMYDMVICCVEKPLLELVLEHAGGNQTHAAEMLGINRNTLRKKMQQHGIE